jgi:hypothetical protein
MAAGKDGTFACTWLDLRNKQTELRLATSKDGAVWSENHLAYQAPDGPICQCCHPSIAFDHQGAVHLLWRNLIAGDRDMYRSSSTDGGTAFSSAVKLGRGSWKLNACPMDGGSFDIHAGRVVTAWRRERIVYATFGDDRKEVRLGPGEQPVVTSTSAGAVVAWLERRPGKLLIQRENDALPTVVAADANDPVMAATSERKQVVLAWETMAHGRPAIRVSIRDPLTLNDR